MKCQMWVGLANHPKIHTFAPLICQKLLLVSYFIFPLSSHTEAASQSSFLGHVKTNQRLLCPPISDLLWHAVRWSNCIHRTVLLWRFHNWSNMQGISVLLFSSLNRRQFYDTMSTLFEACWCWTPNPMHLFLSKAEATSGCNICCT